MARRILLNAGFEDGVLGQWTDASANLTEAVTTTRPHSGVYSIQVTRINSTGPWQIFSGSAAGVKAIQGIAAGDLVTTECWVIHDSTVNRNMNVRHRHYVGTTLISDVNGTVVSVPPDTWTL